MVVVVLVLGERVSIPLPQHHPSGSHISEVPEPWVRLQVVRIHADLHEGLDGTRWI